MSVITGLLRADRRTKNLVKRLRPGDIAVIHHADLDSTAARSLVDSRVAAVVNAARSISGRYPNTGPGLLIEAGVPILDAVGDEFFEHVMSHDGDRGVIAGDAIRLGDGTCGTGTRLDAALVTSQMEAARANLSAELDRFARNTLEYLGREKSILLDPVDPPRLTTRMSGRHVLIVVRGEGYKEDLQELLPYLRDVRPVLVGVDGGADALLAIGLRPDLIVGDMDSVSDAALRSGAELLVHGYPDGRCEPPGLARVRDLGLPATVYCAPGTSEDVAMVLADENGASLIVAVGTHFSLTEFLDKNRSGMASTFLVRLRTGSKLVDAKGIGRLWAERSRSAGREVLMLIAAALVPIAAIAAYSPWFRTVLSTVRLTLRSAFGLR